MSDSFSYKDWVAAATKNYSVTQEVYEAIAAKADELIDLCEKHGLPAVFVAQTHYQQDGGYKFMSAGHISDIEAVCAPLLGVACVARGSLDPEGDMRTAMKCHFEKYPSEEANPGRDIHELLAGIFGKDPNTKH